ncbi:hypothetical protein [Teredinibacter turnerae]|uniref:hypothetical protein n=1 Tax=Teredinibacter turnerae TaxID=2426 RepID=UPI00040739DE|nr:hypothetical protein [Teredinibacter turnerae]
MKIFFGILLLAIVQISHADPNCSENLFLKYIEYRSDVLSLKFNLEKVLSYYKMNIKDVASPLAYGWSIRNQEAQVAEIVEYYFRCNEEGGYLFLKLKSFDPNITRAFIHFVKDRDHYHLKNISHESKKSESSIDSEGVYTILEK